MTDYHEIAIQKHNSVESFINSYITGNEQTEGDKYPEWAAMLHSIVTVMRSGGLDSEDIINGLEDDLWVIDYFLEMEEMDEKKNGE